MILRDAVIVVTGAGAGLGAAIALSLKQQGARVVALDVSDEGFGRVRESGVLPMFADVTDEGAMCRVVSEIVKQFSSIDIWINNAGVWMPPATIDTLDVARARKLLDVNVIGTIIGSKLAYAHMKEKGGGTIVNIISTTALEGRAEVPVYCASKFAVSGFTKSLALAGVQDNIKAIGVYPAGIQTKLFDEVGDPLYDSYMDPSEVAEKIVENLSQDTPDEEQILKRPNA